MTPDEAAAYLGYATPAILGKVPIDPIRITTAESVKASPRYDVRALDAWLDGLSGLMPVVEAASAEEAAADLELEAWRERRRAAP
jgi:hypothetical protein